jgi:hypothetical protein
MKMGKKGVIKHSVYLHDGQVSRWLKNLVKGTPITAEVALRRLSKLCELLNTTPMGIIEKARSDLAHTA